MIRIMPPNKPASGAVEPTCRVAMLAAITCLLFLGGCQKPVPQADESKSPESSTPLRPTDAANTTANQSDPVIDPSVATDTKPAVSVQKELTVTAAEGTAEAAFQQILVAFQKGQLDAAYDSLPRSFQSDVDRLLHSFAERMDPELWSAGIELTRKFASVMKTKKSLILNFDAFKRSPQMELIKPHWDAISTGLFDFTQGEFSNLGRLKQVGVKGLLQSASKLLSGIPLPKFGEVTVTTVKSDADSAVILYRESKESEPQEVVFVKVEGKWLPKSIVEGWASTIRDANTRVNEICLRCATLKSDIKQNLDSINESLTKVQQAQTSEELSNAMIPLIFAIRMGVQSTQQALMENPRSGHAVKIMINRGLSDDEQTKLKDAILAMINSDIVDYEMTSTDGKTQCRFTSVPDLPTLAKLLEGQFPDATVRLNADTKAIEVETK